MPRKILPYKPELKALAKKLRKEMTMSEAILWKELKQKQMLGFDFDRQRPIDNYIVDFYCKDLMLAIEVDGATHYTEQGVERDAIRQTKLESQGIRFLRFDDDDVKTNINGVLDSIREWINNNSQLVGRVDGDSNPPPDPSQEGSLVRSPNKSPLFGGDLGLPARPAAMGNKLFYFKQFSVRHDRSGMKVGTDGVLLGAWVDVTDATQMLDIGTGTGVIALMLAQRTAPYTHIDAVELDEKASEDAHENIMASPWANRISLHLTAIQNFNPETKFDLIISNPPYFQNSFKPPDQQRERARHTQQLTFQDLLEAATRLLSPAGKLNVILPNTEGLEFIEHALQRGLYCARKWSFKARPKKPIERWLLEFSRIPKTQQQGEIILYKSGEEWTEDYKELTREFYLKL